MSVVYAATELGSRPGWNGSLQNSSAVTLLVITIGKTTAAGFPPVLMASFAVTGVAHTLKSIKENLYLGYLGLWLVRILHAEDRVIL
jgi:hypothetical protein